MLNESIQLRHGEGDSNFCAENRAKWMEGDAHQVLGEEDMSMEKNADSTVDHRGRFPNRLLQAIISARKIYFERHQQQTTI